MITGCYVIKIKSNPQKIKPTALEYSDLSPLKRSNCLSIPLLLDLLLGKHYQEDSCNGRYELAPKRKCQLCQPKSCICRSLQSHLTGKSQQKSFISSLDAKNQIKK
jgi:hypothetical protein